MGSSAGIVSVMRFERPGDEHFSGYINYINRSDAMRSKHFKDWNAVKYDGYNQYMENPEKSTGIFTAGKDQLNLDARKQLRQSFEKAERNGSVMWQTVVSFDNTFLAEYGLYDLQTQEVDQQKLRTAIRTGMSRLLANEGLTASALWSASIHLNTDNIHVHIATVEPDPEREFMDFNHDGKVVQERKGYLKASTLNKFKSAVANELLNRDPELAQISSLIRDRLPAHQESWRNLPDRQLMNYYKQIYSKLPADRRQWRYNMNGMKDLRPLLDGFASRYMQLYHKTELETFDSQLMTEVNFREFLYGKGQPGKEENRSQDYYDNKYDELFARMGNSVLKEMLAQDRRNQNKQDNPEKDATGLPERSSAGGVPNHGILSSLKAIKNLFRGEVQQHLLNKQAHDRSAAEEENKRNNQNQDLYR
ncbi:relaxase MobL [Lacticaseibacillus paracasei]|uniref:MobP2 family relaxase n=1 Tax=Lacticaseibacillus paracasei TaxID=1597 RepID=UPI0021A5B568|nr:MobP2 family relaxase [Lacticaseibacillus paracasei]UWP76167.1 relaxase MobL [Lacticaseibacillus paracasei]